ncbi:hypothetical protein HDU79_003141 [Rhizoclosmatium sp. JEL0117]|nr:hypothetical protein HDU79_003141 [Rhizoclosmatium sp. JEL0117]
MSRKGIATGAKVAHIRPAVEKDITDADYTEDTWTPIASPQKPGEKGTSPGSTSTFVDSPVIVHLHGHVTSYEQGYPRSGGGIFSKKFLWYLIGIHALVLAAIAIASVVRFHDFGEVGIKILGVLSAYVFLQMLCVCFVVADYEGDRERLVEKSEAFLNCNLFADESLPMTWFSRSPATNRTTTSAEATSLRPGQTETETESVRGRSRSTSSLRSADINSESGKSRSKSKSKSRGWFSRTPISTETTTTFELFSRPPPMPSSVQTSNVPALSLPNDVDAAEQYLNQFNSDDQSAPLPPGVPTHLSSTTTITGHYATLSHPRFNPVSNPLPTATTLLPSFPSNLSSNTNQKSPISITPLPPPPSLPLYPPPPSINPSDHISLSIYYHEQTNHLDISTYHASLSAAQGNAIGLFLYALALRHGLGTDPNPTLATQILAHSANAAMRTYSMSSNSSTEVSFTDTLSRLPGTGKLRGLAKKELGSALYELGNSYRNGWGVEKSEEVAWYYFMVAGGLGDVDANVLMGDAYMRGEIGRKVDKRVAAGCYRKAVEYGYSEPGLQWIYKEKYM